MPTGPLDLGPDYTITLFSNGRKTVVYDLYPLVPGGPRAHRAVPNKPEEWFYGPVNMAASLELLGVTIPTATSTAGVVATPPPVVSSAPPESFAQILSQSKFALTVAGLAAVGVMVLLAFAARRSQRLDRRRTVPAAVARLETAAARAAAGRPLRPAVAGQGGFGPGGPGPGPGAVGAGGRPAG